MLLAALAFACNDELTQEVGEDICVSSDPSGAVLPGIQWIGGRRGSPEMYPGGDCVGCHLENDGPELMFGGTVYPFVSGDFEDIGLTPPNGNDCFGLEGVTVKVTGDDGQEFITTSNRAGNFFIEGKARDLKKPFQVEMTYQPTFREEPIVNPMGTRPNYGGCGRCHNPDAERYPPGREPPPGYTLDQLVSPAGSRIGVAGLLQ